MLRATLATLLISPLAFAACGGDAESGSPEHDQIATGVGGLLADPDGGEKATFDDAVFGLRGRFGTGLALSSAGVISGSRGNLTLKYEYGCKDTGGGNASDCTTAASADFKVEWKGKLEKAKYKLEIDRKGEWKLTALSSDTVIANGHTSYSVKSDFKDKTADVRYKYDFDFDTQYQQVQIRTSDGALVGGTATFDLDAKQKSDDGTTVLKTHTKMRTKVTFEADGTATLELDSKYRYKLTLESGEVRFDSKIE